jgi:hypothetical protein
MQRTSLLPSVRRGLWVRLILPMACIGSRINGRPLYVDESESKCGVAVAAGAKQASPWYALTLWARGELRWTIVYRRVKWRKIR